MQLTIGRSICRYLHARYDPLKDSPVIKALRDSLEHKLWPIHDEEKLKTYGLEELEFIAQHFSELTSLTNFNLNEAKRQFQKAKLRMRSLPYYSMKFKDFWSHISTHFDEALHGYPDLLIIVRIILLIVCDTSCCEVGYSAYNRTHTASRSRLKVCTVRDVLTTHFVGNEIKDFKA